MLSLIFFDFLVIVFSYAHSNNDNNYFEVLKG